MEKLLVGRQAGGDVGHEVRGEENKVSWLFYG